MLKYGQKFASIKKRLTFVLSLIQTQYIKRYYQYTQKVILTLRNLTKELL